MPLLTPAFLALHCVLLITAMIERSRSSDRMATSCSTALRG